MKKTIASLAAIAWASVAIASAAPANALAFTTQWGEYANCSNSWSVNYNGNYDCWYSASYEQYIKFVETRCNEGGCNSDVDLVLVDSLYGPGRKVAYFIDYCGWAYMFSLGACAC